MARENAAITVTVGEYQESMTLAFANGETIRVNRADLSEEILRHAVMHGLKQKLVDAAAISRNPDTGRSATVGDKYAAVREVYDRLLAGNWNTGRGEGSGAGAGAGGLLFRALCRLYSRKTPEQIRTFLAGKGKDERAALRKNLRVSAIIEEIKAEMEKSTPTDGDGEDQLAELDD